MYYGLRSRASHVFRFRLCSHRLMSEQIVYLDTMVDFGPLLSSKLVLVLFSPRTKPIQF